MEVWFSVDQDSTDIRFCGFFCGSSTITTTATSTATTTATATAERLFEALRVYCLVILSTDRGLVVLRFCEGAEELSTREALRVINVEDLSVGDL